MTTKRSTKSTKKSTKAKKEEAATEEVMMEEVMMEEAATEVLKKEPEPLPKGTGLTISGNRLTAEEESALRKMSELYFRRKGVAFSGATLDQRKLDNLLTVPTFVSQLGRLASKR